MPRRYAYLFAVADLVEAPSAPVRAQQETVAELQAKADQGGASAQFNLGLIYLEGQGVPQDGAEAVRWYRLAAEQGHAVSQNNLGLMYVEGQAVSQDHVQAYKWCNLAASSGATGEDREGMIGNRDRVYRLLTPDQRAEAQRLVREWNAAHPR